MACTGTLRSFAWAFALVIATPLVAEAQPVSKTYPVAQGKTYKFEKIADGVYYASPEFKGTAFPFGSNPFFGANLVVIVNKDDVLLVDSATTPRAARALMADVKRLTDKPIRTVVNTHWHYDHTDGNSAFGPDVQIIGHEYVRHAIETFDTFPHRFTQQPSGEGPPPAAPGIDEIIVVMAPGYVDVAKAIARDAKAVLEGRVKTAARRPTAWIDWTLDYGSSSKLRSLLGRSTSPGST